MLGFLKNALGLGPAADFASLLAQGALIVDVRTPGEFSGGNIKGSKNIPLPSLSGRLAELHKGKPVITCCASGIRSATAKRILEAAGFPEVHNGGGWRSLQGRLR